MSDRQLYHELKLQAKKMSEFFEYMEMKEYQSCKFYLYDSEACEEQCTCSTIARIRGFVPEEECWACTKFEMRTSHALVRNLKGDIISEIEE